MTPEMRLTLPPEVIRSVIQAEVAKALGKSEQLIQGVVAAALSEKRERYSNHTIFEEEVSKMIREVAVEGFKEWLAENKEKIRAELKRQLQMNKGKLVTDLVEQFTDKLGSLYASLTLRFPDDK